MAEKLRPGVLVELQGLQAGATPVTGSDTVGTTLEDAAGVDFNGRLAQLLEYHAEQKLWLVVTMDGDLLMAGPKNFTVVGGSSLGSTDMVFGPASDPRFLSEELAQLLVDKGHASVQLVMSAGHRQAMLDLSDDLTDEKAFMRMPRGCEEGYLGKNGKGKCLMVDFQDEDCPKFCKACEPLVEQDQNFGTLSGLLLGYAEEHFGFMLHTRTPTLLYRTFDSPQEEAEYIPQVPEPSEADQFIGIMQRKRICLVEFIGPSTGTITLTARDAYAEDVQLDAKPGTLIVYNCNQYEHCFIPDGDALTLQCWFLDEPPQFSISGDVEGNKAALGSMPAGPPMPKTDHDVALVGMGVRNPGCSDDRFTYWQTCRNGGADGMLEIPMSRYDMEAYADWRVDRQFALDQGKMYCRHQGHLEGIEMFDAQFFSVSTAVARGMDVEQRLTLETSWVAMADYGYDRKKTSQQSAHIGVFVGISGSDWNWVPVEGGSPECGGSEAVIAGRVTFALNLKGPAQIINTACSASLVSMHSSKLHMCFKYDQLETSISTGISINVTPHVFMGNCQTGSLSFVGRSWSFDHTADGFGRSEGTSSGLWKLTKFGPTTYGMLAGSQINHDGRSASLTAPNGPAQERAIKAVLAEVKIEPPEVDAFECHGTGTSLGDPIEVGSFRRLYNKKPRYTAVLATTSKTNLGHTEGGAGIAGFFKCILMLMYNDIAPNIHLRELNPHLEMDGFPCWFISEACLMTADRGFAGVSSFGVSGTNGHCLGYGINVMNSRAGRGLNYKSIILDKIEVAKPLVHTSHEGWEEWQNFGRPHVEEKAGTEYQVEVLEDGSTTWREIERPLLRNLEGPFHITGSFNGWRMEDMVPWGVAGLFATEVEIGDSGEESFQIAYNENTSMCYYPQETFCASKTATIRGPAAPPSQDNAWVIKGQPGDFVRVEFFLFKSGSRATINWIPIKD
jgi:polyketide synthase-associated protein